MTTKTLNGWRCPNRCCQHLMTPAEIGCKKPGAQCPKCGVDVRLFKPVLKRSA